MGLAVPQSNVKLDTIVVESHPSAIVDGQKAGSWYGSCNARKQGPVHAQNHGYSAPLPEGATFRRKVYT